MNRCEVSVVMPALNEERNILSAVSNTLKAFEDFNIEGEIIVINDGSTDNTKDLVNDIIKKDDRVRVISHDTPQGMGASFWDGVDNVMGDIVVMLPGDNENDPWEILRYFDLLEHVDIVIPFVFNREVRPLFRNILSLIYREIIDTTFTVNLNYTNGTVLYRKSILREVGCRSKGFFFQTDILIRLIKRGYLFAEVPYRLNVRNLRTSKAVTFPSLLDVIKGYFRLLKDIQLDRKGKVSRQFAGDSSTYRRRNNKHDKEFL